MRMPVPKRAIMMSPARTTASTAVVRKSGSSRSPLGVGLAPRFDHADLHAAFGRALEVTSSMKLRIRKMPRPLAFQQVLRRQRIGDVLGVEARALIADADVERGAPASAS